MSKQNLENKTTFIQYSSIVHALSLVPRSPSFRNPVRSGYEINMHLVVNKYIMAYYRKINYQSLQKSVYRTCISEFKGDLIDCLDFP